MKKGGGEGPSRARRKPTEDRTSYAVGSKGCRTTRRRLPLLLSLRLLAWEPPLLRTHASSGCGQGRRGGCRQRARG